MTTQQHEENRPADQASPGNASGKHHGKRAMSRGLKIVLWILGILIAIPVIAIIILLTFDWNRAKPWLNAKVSDAIDRPFAIVGDLSVKWERPSDTIIPGQRTWRDHIPWPHLYANDVHVGNPANMARGDTASVRQVSFSLNPFPLLKHTINIPVLRVDGPRLELLRTDATHYNWAYKHEKKESKWELDLERLVLAKGVIHIKDAVTDADITADVDTIANDPTYGVAFKVHGTYNDAPVTGGGKTGGVLTLKDQDAPFPVQADVRSGPARLALEGTVTRPAKLAGVDLQLKLAGRSLARLYPFTGVVLPETPPFSTDGHLTGTLADESDSKRSRWTYEKFKGKVGESDINGTLTFQGQKPRNKLSGTIHSNQLRFADLGPLVGADSNASKRERGVAAVQPKDKALPVEKFNTAKWKVLDADVRFTADRIVKTAQLPLNKLNTHLTLDNGVLKLHPLNFGLAGGTVTSDITLDGSGGAGKDAIKATLDATARHIEVKQLFPQVQKIQQATAGDIYAQAKLTATGDSVGEMLAKSNGEVKGLVSEGVVSKLLLEEAGLNVGNIIITKLFGDKQVQLNCLASDLDVKNGVASTNTFVLDTEEAIVDINGWVNLGNEQMDLRVKPETKALRLFTLRTPFYVRGTFKKPDLQLDKKVLAMKGGAAVALAVVAAPAAALLPLINTGPGEKSPCASLLAEARAKPQAPPPGKQKR
ncbi:AsmA family protein [Massilia norwichensis]|uniref:AsmA family protein n=1 Tax=Massilia norwichensis TaxID=1442366 RepID=A0ABT2A791_9BURK|nr:AsmA family protein [Massilia norwichensis]MCS0590071.1 AsmA family protein [Massilia norwichensis]